MDFEQRQEVEQILESISTGNIKILEQEIYALVYNRDKYKARELIVNEYLS